MLATMSEDLNFIPETHTVEEETYIYKCLFSQTDKQTNRENSMPLEDCLSYAEQGLSYQTVSPVRSLVSMLCLQILLLKDGFILLIFGL